MAAKYLIRFDDLCPTMNWTIWDQVEPILREHGILPIVAVVPDNRDSSLCIAPERPDFWDRVREWQHLGWTIAVHGHQHLYTSTDPGIIGINRRSEFAGLPRESQATNLAEALKIFESQGLRPTVWVAPGHSFDWNTLVCLRDCGIAVISDGFFTRPVRRAGCVWIPQQLWRMRRMPLGTWTICHHINTWGPRQVRQFARNIRIHHDAIVGVERLLSGAIGELSLLDRMFSVVYRRVLLARRALVSQGAC